MPIVALTSPVAGATATANATFNLEATATDTDGSITQVDFLRNGVVIFTDNEAPYAYADNGLEAGHYSYQARATDNDGFSTTTAVNQVVVTLPPGTPLANAALSFDGVNDYVTMGPAPELRTGAPATPGFTLECWFKRQGSGVTASSGSGGVSVAPLISHGRGENDNATLNCNYLFGITAAGLLAADFEEGPTGTTVGLNHPITGNTTVTNNVWHHAAVTYDGTTWKLYLNGVLEANTVAAGQPPAYDTIQHFAIGSALNSSGVPEGAFHGVIDEVRVWNYARSATEIAAAKDSEIGTGSGLIGRFGLNEGSGTTATSTSTASVGTLTNNPVWVAGAPFSTANTAPVITLEEPLNNARSYMPYPVTFTAEAADSDGVAKVEFFVDGAKVGESTESPYNVIWTPPAIGTYAVTARAQDNLGARTLSSATTLIIETNPNQAPTVTPTLPANSDVLNATSATLQTSLADPEGDGMTVTFYGRQDTPLTPGEDFTLVAIPDTQYYSEGSASRANTVTVQQLIGTFGAQTQWAVDNRQARNIAFVSHMGDIVENGNFGGNDIQWQRASAAMANLENPVTTLLANGIPFGVAPGNHDIDPIGAYDTGSTLFYNQYFGVSRFDGRSYYGGHYGTDNTNSYSFFTASGLDFMVIHFAYDTTPNAAILNWADALLKANPHRRAIVTSHYIIGQGNPASFGAQGAGIYNALKDNPNLFLMLCGHIHAEGRRSDVFEGRTIYSVLSDYQGLPNGGQGFLRTFTFSPANNRIRVESWSPTLNRAALQSDGLPHFDGTFDLPYNMQAPISEWVALGTVTVPAGGTVASLNWTGLDRGKQYEWYAAVTDGVNVVSSAASTFSTSPGQAPTVSLTTPVAGAEFLSPATIALAATASDTDGTVSRVEFYNGGTKIGQDDTEPYEFTWTGVAAGSYTLSAQAIDDSNLLGVSNGAAIVVNLGDIPPTVSLTSPTEGTLLEAPADITLVADANDTEAPVTKVQFYSGALTPVLIGEDGTAPFTLELNDLGPGSHTFTARATDSVNQVTTSSPVTISVFTEVTPPDVSAISVATFDPPAWTVVQTSPAPLNFNLPGTDLGDVELRINGASVPFINGIALATNWGGPASTGNSSNDNLVQPYSNASGNLFVSVLDNTKKNAAGANPGTSEQTSGVSVAFLPYSSGFTGASVNSGGTIIASNLPAGVTVTRPGGTGNYAISGLSTAGNLLAFTNGDSGTLADNICNVRISNGRWQVQTRDNGNFTQDNEWSFVYLPPETTGVFTGLLSSAGVVSNANASAASFGVTATVTASGIDLTIGDGSVINPTTAALFLSADTTTGGDANAAADNLISWSANGNSFQIFTQDLVEVTSAFEAIDLRFLVLPYAPVQIPPALTLTAPAATSTTKSPVAVAFTIADAAPAGSVQLSFGSNVLTLAASQATLGAHSFSFHPANPTASAEIASGSAIPDGVYTVTLSYLDSTGAVLASASTTNVRIDTTAPALTLPTPITAEATSASGAVVDYTASASDMGSGIASSSFSPVSGSTFALGSTTVNAAATDNAGNATMGNFTVTVQDTTAPAIAPVADIGAVATSNAGAVVDYPAPSITDAVGVTEVNYSHPSGSTFPTGTTTVTITARDATNNTSTDTFDVSVLNLAFTLPAQSAILKEAAAGVKFEGSTAASTTTVTLTINGGAPLPAVLSTTATGKKWTLTTAAGLVPGTNSVVATASTGASTVSTSARTFFYEVLRPLTATIIPTGAGTLTFSPALTNGTAVVGRSYTVTAKANKGYFFESWSGKASGTTPSATFIFAEGDTATAGFEGSPFTDAVAGLYNGIFKGSTPETDTQTNAGLFSATISKDTGAFTGKLMLDGTTAPVAGVFHDETLQFTSPALSNGFVTSLTLDIANASITGTITKMKRGNAISTLNISAPKSYGKTDLPATHLTGAHNLAFTAPVAPLTLLADEYTQGSGYGVLTISATDGASKFAGVLADGTAFTSASVLCKTRVVPVYASFASSIGALVGNATVDTAPAATDVTSTGLRWFRRASNSQYYPWGYDSGLTLDLLGAKQTGSTQASLGLSSTPLVEFTGGPFATLVSQLLGTAPKGFLSTDKATSLSFSSTGLMTGSHTAAGSTGKHSIKGIIVGKPGTTGKAYGHILSPAPANTNGTGQAGNVEVKP